MRIIQESERIESVSYRLLFQSVEDSSFGYSFECDEKGNLTSQSSAACDNYKMVVSNPDKYIPKGVQTYRHSYKVSAIGICDDCGKPVELDAFTNTCECGADYNWSGQRLAPRSQWGEETGEHWTDCY